MPVASPTCAVSGCGKPTFAVVKINGRNVELCAECKRAVDERRTS